MSTIQKRFVPNGQKSGNKKERACSASPAITEAKAILTHQGHGGESHKWSRPFIGFVGKTRDGNPGGLTRPGVGSAAFGEG